MLLGACFEIAVSDVVKALSVPCMTCFLFSLNGPFSVIRPFVVLCVVWVKHMTSGKMPKDKKSELLYSYTANRVLRYNVNVLTFKSVFNPLKLQYTI